MLLVLLLFLLFVKWVVIPVTFQGCPVVVEDVVALGPVIAVPNVVQWVFISEMSGSSSRCSFTWYCIVVFNVVQWVVILI